MYEFTVVLNDDATFDISMDGERCYYGLTPEDLKEFAESFILDNYDS